MAEAHSAAMELGPHKMTLDEEVLQVLIAGNKVNLDTLLRGEGGGGGDSHLQTNGQVAINFQASATVTAPAPAPRGTCRLLGGTNNGSTALHIVARHGHAELAALICERAPSLAATCNRCLDTALHCAARAGHRDVAACLLRTMQGGITGARNKTGATALHEAVRHSRVEVVDLLMTMAPWLVSVTTEGGVSPLYMASAAAVAVAVDDSLEMIQALLRPLQNGEPSPASAAGPEGRTALHVAATLYRKEIAEVILGWEPEGPSLLTRVDSSGKTPLHFAVMIHTSLCMIVCSMWEHHFL